jgi:predicted GNAT superfamily acetyltransferase
MKVEIKPIRHLLDLRKTHEIQRRIWGFRDEMIIPYTQMITVIHNGGTLLGGYVDGALVGFVYGYLGMSGNTLYLFSMRMGVLPEYQSYGVGTALKLAQRDQMLRQGIDMIVWTYDPLLGLNARLNIEKLGGFSRAYVRDIYGSGIDNPLQAGLALDRFLLEWHLMSDRVRKHLSGNAPRPDVQTWLENPDYRLVNYANWNSDLPRPIASDLELDDSILLVQLPKDFSTIKRLDLGVARGWRNMTRYIFEAYFRRGYIVTGFATDKDPKLPNIYKLEKRSFPAPLDYFSWAKGIEGANVLSDTPNPVNATSNLPLSSS